MLRIETCNFGLVLRFRQFPGPFGRLWGYGGPLLAHYRTRTNTQHQHKQHKH